MKLEIKAQHCEPGHECSSTKCVVACAINDILKPEFVSSVGLGSFAIFRAKDIIEDIKNAKPILPHLSLRKDASKLITLYDGKSEVKPCTVEIEDIPAEYLR